MARDIESLVLQMNADISKMTRQLDKAQGNFDRTANAIERRQRQLDKSLANLGREAGNFARPVQMAATVALGAITAMSYNAAKRAEAVSGAFDQTFRDMPAAASKATSAIAEDFNRLETDIKDNFTQLRSVISALGVDAQTSLGIVDQLQRRSLDMAAFKDVSDADAFRAVISGITGETEPLKRFGVVLNETAVSAELLRLGFKGKAKDASEAAKVIARTNIILRQTAEMNGQVAREADTLAEKEKRVRTEFTRAAEDFGQQFLPVAAKVLDWTTKALNGFNDLPSGVQAAGLALLALVAAGGPIMAVIKGLQAVIKAAVAARAAMAVIGGSAGAGLAGGAAAGAGAGALARTAPVAAGALAVGAGTASFARAPVRDEAMVQRDLGLERQRLAQLRSRGANASRIAAAERRVTTRLAELSRVQKAADTEAAKAENEVQAAVAAATSGLGDFGLTPDLLAGGSGSGSKGRGGSGKAAENAAARQAEARQQLSLQLAIDIARASGDEAAIKAAERRNELARLTAQYEAAGYTDAAAQAQTHLGYLNQAEDAAEARERAADAAIKLERIFSDIAEEQRKATELQIDRTMDQLGYQAELARAQGDETGIKNAERRLFIEQRTLEILRLKLATSEAEARAMAGGEYDTIDRAEEARNTAQTIVSVLRSDNIWEEAGRRFKDAAWNGVEDMLTQIIGALTKGGSGGGLGGLMSHGSGNEWWKTALSFLSGAKAVGGGVVRGKNYLVGERGPEILQAPFTGNIIPNVNQAMSRMQSGRAAAPRAAQPILFDLRGAVVTDDLLGQINQVGSMAAAGAVATSSQVIPSEQARVQRYSRGRP